jgi:hypothetical protein
MTASNPKRYLLATLGISLCALGIFLIFYRLPYLEVNSGDFKQDYYAARQFQAGESIYSSQKVDNNHPPFVALLFIPWTVLPYRQAILLWTVGSIGLFFLSGWIVLSELRIKLRIEWILLLCGFLLCWYQFHANIALGQLSILISCCIIAGWAFLRRKHDIPAGILLGFATLIKLFPGLMIVYLIIFKRWRALASMATVVGVGEALSLLLVGKEDFMRFMVEVSPQNAQTYIPFPGNISLSGAFARLFWDGPWVKPLIHLPEAASGLTILATLFVLLIMTVQMHRLTHLSGGSDAAYAINILAMLLVSPLTWQHIFPILALPFGILLERLQRDPHLSLIRILLLVVLMISLPDFEIGRTLMAIFAPYQMPWYAALIFLVPTLSLLILWVLLIREGVEKHA